MIPENPTWEEAKAAVLEHCEWVPPACVKSWVFHSYYRYVDNELMLLQHGFGPIGSYSQTEEYYHHGWFYSDPFNDIFGPFSSEKEAQRACALDNRYS
jgi:hypothetical protein